MFGIERNHIIAVVAVITCMYPLWGIFFKNKQRDEQAQKIDELRHRMIHEKIESLKGQVIEIEQTKRSECPVIDVIEIGSQAYHICYRVSYRVDSRIEETWALYNTRSKDVPLVWPEFDALEDAE